MDTNNNGQSDDHALLDERNFSDNSPPNTASMDIKQIVENQSFKKANRTKMESGASTIIQNNKSMLIMMLLMISIIVIIALSIVALLIMSCQMGDKIGKIQEKITKMEENLERQINGLKNGTQGMHEQIKEIIKFIKLDPVTNELNPADCSSDVTISRNGLDATVNYVIGWSGVRAFAPVFNFGDYKPSIFFYFEVTFHSKNGYIYIGFCNKEFPLYGQWLGNISNSIGIRSTDGIWIDGSETKFGSTQDFNEGDVAGLGIIHSPTNSSMIKCFATLNGKLLGKVDLPSKFTTLEANRQLFPAITMYRFYDSIHANFGKEPFHFNVSNELFQ